MAYDRYDPERRRWDEDDRNSRNWHRDERGFGGRDERDFHSGRDRDRDDRHDQSGGGFFERMGNEVRSWFGDDDDPGREDRSRRDEHYGRDDDWRARGWSNSARDYNRDYRQELSRGQRDDDRDGERSYRPIAGDYARSGDSRSGDSGQRYREELDRGRRGQSMVDDDRGTDWNRGAEWDQDPIRRTSFAGSRARSNHDDLHYQQWRRRQVEDLDRDYDDYRRERQSHFENDFGDWRNRRQSKREMLRDIREHMEVVGNDGEHVGTVDRVAGDRIILTRSDPQSGGAHHSLSCSEVERVEDNRVLLEVSASQARERWRDESRGRALFEREDQGSAGPHVLDRSFSGTYR